MPPTIALGTGLVHQFAATAVGPRSPWSVGRAWKHRLEEPEPVLIGYGRDDHAVLIDGCHAGNPRTPAPLNAFMTRHITPPDQELEITLCWYRAGQEQFTMRQELDALDSLHADLTRELAQGCMFEIVQRQHSVRQ